MTPETHSNILRTPGEHGINLRLVPKPYSSWIESRRDILRGEWSYNENTQRSVSQERSAIKKYLGKTDADFPEYTKFIRHLLTSPQNNKPEKGMAGMTKLGRRSIFPMENECRLSVIIPAKGEEKNIYKTLSSYSNQIDKDGKPIDPRTWEINVVVNVRQGEKNDKTYDEIIRFKQNYPNIRVNALEITLQKSWANVGFIRKLASDLSLFRSYLREEQKAPHYIESDDADLVWVDPHLVNTVTSTFDAHPELDSLTGYQEKNLREIAEVEHIFLSRRFWDIMTTQAFHYLRKGAIPAENRNFTRSRPFTYGVNTAHTSHAHALIGGYDWEGKVGEDLDIGYRISLLRGSVKNRVFEPELRSLGLMKTRTNSSPRRYLWALLKDVGQMYTEENFSNGECKRLSHNEMINKTPMTYRRIDENSKRFFEKELWFLYENLKEIMPKQELAKKIASRTMLLLGFGSEDFTITDDEIKINHSFNFSTALWRYRQRKPYDLTSKGGEKYV